MPPKINTVAPKYRSSWFTAAQCRSYYGVPYQFREIQIHWWGDPATKPLHDGVVNYIANKTGGSVNYVASGGRVTRMVSEQDCALTTQNGNPYGIKIECSPYGTDTDYQTIGWLVADIRKRYGNIPLVPHKKYWNTACPGTLSLDRINKEAAKFLQGGDMPKRAIPPKLVAEHYINYTNGHVNWVKEGDPATLNRFEDPEDDEFWYGLKTQQLHIIQQLDTKIAELQTALTNEQNKPPVEVIKEVQVIVEKPIEVPVPATDNEAAEKIAEKAGPLVSFLKLVWDKLRGK